MTLEEIAELRQRRYNATVVYLRKTHPDLMILRARPDFPRPEHLPGQYTTLGLGLWEPRFPGCQEEELKPGDEGRLVRRAYSLSCSILDDDEGLLDLALIDWLEFYLVLVRRTEDPHRAPALTPRLFMLREGDRLQVGEKVTGQLTLEPVKPDDNVVFLATGTGEAPHNYMVWHLLRSGHRGRTVSVCCVRYRRDPAYLPAHAPLAAALPNSPYVSLPRGEGSGSVSEVIGGYQVKSLLQTGQTSQVFEVVEPRSMRHFAMKILLPETASDPTHRAALFHEAQVGIKLAHPNVIKIVNVNKDSQSPFFVMEFFPSGSLKLRLLRKEGEFLREHAEKIFKQAATALAYMNANGWVHRDVKPDNILVNGIGEVKLIDFAIASRPPSGLAKLFHRRGKAQGTRSYMSPEQSRGQILDGRADVYSFGATCYEVVTGRPPFRGKSAQELLEKQIVEKPVAPKILNPDVTDEFSNLILKM